MSAVKVYAGVDRFLEAIDRPIVVLALTALMVSASMLFVGAIYRYVFSQSITLFEELSVNMVIWAVMLYGGPLFKRGGHVGMDFVSKKLNRQGQAFLQLIIDLSLLFICGILIWKGMEIVRVMHMVGKTTHSGEMQIWILMLPVPIGCALYGTYGIGGIIKVLCAMIDPSLAIHSTSAHTAAHTEEEESVV